MLRRIGCILIVLSVFLSGCKSRESTSDHSPSLVVSILPLAFFVEHLVGSDVAVSVMIPPGAGAETFEPSLRELEIVSKASLYVALGHPSFVFEQVWLNQIRAGNPGLKIVDLYKNYPVPAQDPHLWLAPQFVAHMIGRLRDEFSALWPTHTPQISERAATLLEQVRQLAAHIHSELAPYRGRSFLVLHPAWEHFAEAFGLKQLSIEHEGKEPDPAHLARVLEAARAQNIHTVFVEPQFPRQSAELLARELGARIVVIDDLAYDWFENMSTVTQLLGESFRR